MRWTSLLLQMTRGRRGGDDQKRARTTFPWLVMVHGLHFFFCLESVVKVGRLESSPSHSYLWILRRRRLPLLTPVEATFDVEGIIMYMR